jgi:hypothetical protein
MDMRDGIGILCLLLCMTAARNIYLKGQCHEIFVFRFFHESVSPSP